MRYRFPPRLEPCTGFALALLLAGPAAFAEQGGSLRQFEITATRFQFDSDRIVVNQGDRVRIVLRSTDVDHGFAVVDYDVDVVIPASGGRLPSSSSPIGPAFSPSPAQNSAGAVISR